MDLLYASCVCGGKLRQIHDRLLFQAFFTLLSEFFFGGGGGGGREGVAGLLS